MNTNRTVLNQKLSCAHCPFAVTLCGCRQILPGNTNVVDVKENALVPPMVASRVRFLPYSEYSRTVCLRVELLGCRRHGERVLTPLPSLLLCSALLSSLLSPLLCSALLSSPLLSSPLISSPIISSPLLSSPSYLLFSLLSLSLFLSYTNKHYLFLTMAQKHATNAC